MRLFVAINLPGEVRSSLGRLIEDLRIRGDIIRWTRENKIHLTLKFLGEVSSTLMGDVEGMLSERIPRHPPFEMILEEVGAFPNVKRPRIVWVGVRKDKVLEAIQRDLEDGFSELGFEKEGRTFKPHLTIGRIKRRRREQGGDDSPTLNERPGLKDFTGAAFRVTSVELMESFLKPTGAEYRVNKSIDLFGFETLRDN
jgi:2'-5' RNA ligase